MLLAGRDLPLGEADDEAEDDAASRAVLAELAAAAPAAVTTRDLAMVGHAFAFAGDVPMTCASLAGFCLAVRYAEPYLPHADPGAQALITAAYYLANPPNNP